METRLLIGQAFLHLDHWKLYSEIGSWQAYILSLLQPFAKLLFSSQPEVNGIWDLLLYNTRLKSSLSMYIMKACECLRTIEQDKFLPTKVKD